MSEKGGAFVRTTLVHKGLVLTLAVSSTYLALLAIRPAVAEVVQNGFTANGFNSNGFNSNGFNSNGFNSNGFNSNGFNSNGVLQNGFNSNGLNANGFNVNGFNSNGFNSNGFNSNGFNSNGLDINGFNSNGFNSNGFNSNGFNTNGFNSNGFSSNGFNSNGFNSNGINVNGFNSNGFNSNGFNSNGFDSNGFNSNGFNSNGFNSNGVPFVCFDVNGKPQSTNSPCVFDINGYDTNGYDSRGIDRNGWYRPDLRPALGEDPTARPLIGASCVAIQGPNGPTANALCSRRNTIFEPDACVGANVLVTYPPSDVFASLLGQPAPPVTGFDLPNPVPAGAYRCPWGGEIAPNVFSGEFAQSGFNSQGYAPDGYDRDGFNQVNFSRAGTHRPRLTGYYDYGFVRPPPSPPNAMDKAGINLANLEDSLIFGNVAVHNALMSSPLTVASLTDPGSALYQIWSDPFSIQAMLYLWSDAKSPGDDLSYDPCADLRPGAYGATHPSRPSSCPISFFGALGICDRGLICPNLVRQGVSPPDLPAQPGQPCRDPASPRGWVADQPLQYDFVCQHLVSGVFMAQVNSLGIHNLISFAAPDPPNHDGDNVRNQLTRIAPAIPVFPFKFGTDKTVEAVGSLCDGDAGTETKGPSNCSWTPAYDGVCTPFASVTVSLDTTSNPKHVPIMLQVQQGVHALNYPNSMNGQCIPGDPYCAAGDFLGAVPFIQSGSDPTAATPPLDPPSVTFSCPASGVFSVQWAPFDRSDYPKLSSAPVAFVAVGGGAKYPASELDVFPRQNMEAYWAGNIFGVANLNAAVPQCEVRLPQAICGPGQGVQNACIADSNYLWISHAGVDDPLSPPDYVRCELNADVCFNLTSDPTYYGVCGDTGKGTATRCQTDTQGCCVPCSPVTFDLYAQADGQGTPLTVEVQPQFSVSPYAIPVSPFFGNPYGVLQIGGHFGAGTLNGNLYVLPSATTLSEFQSVAQIIVNKTQQDFVVDSVDLEAAVSSWSNLETGTGQVSSDPLADPWGVPSGVVLILPVKQGVVVESGDLVKMLPSPGSGNPLGCTVATVNSSACSFNGYRAQVALVPDYDAPPIAAGIIQNNVDTSVLFPAGPSGPPQANCVGTSCKQHVTLLTLDKFEPSALFPTTAPQNVDQIRAVASGQAVAVVVVPTVGAAANPYRPGAHVNTSNLLAFHTGSQIALKTSQVASGTFSNLTSPPYYTGAYVTDVITRGGGSTTYSYGQNGIAAPGLFGVRKQQLTLALNGHNPLGPSIAFPNAHVWLSKNWGDTQGYYQNRACTSDLSTCIAHYEGTIESTPTTSAGCTTPSVDHVGLSPLGDVMGCFFANVPGGNPMPATFSDGTVTSGNYPAYGVTTFLPNYNAGPEAIVNIACLGTSAPTALAYAPATVCPGSTVTLDASGSISPGKNVLTFSWKEANGAVAPLTGAKPTFTAPASGTLSFTLVATDPCGHANSTSVNVAVSNANQPPVARIAGTRVVGSTVVLDGNASSDPNGYPLTFAWSQTGGPPVSLSDPTSSAPYFAIPSGPATLSFQLQVTNSPAQGCATTALSSTANVEVFVPGNGSVFALSPVGGLMAGVPEVYTFELSPDPGPSAITVTCGGQPAQLIGNLSPYSFVCTFQSVGSFEVRVDVANTSGPPATLILSSNPSDSVPTIAVPAPIFAAAQDPAGAVVSFVATATDVVDGAVSVSCTPASGSTFPVNTQPGASTTVTCTSTNSRGLTSTQTFPVRVFDDVPPTFAAGAPLALPQQAGIYYTHIPSAAAWLVASVPVASDNVGVASTVLIDTVGGTSTVTDVSQLGGLLLIDGLHTLVFRATDTSGNTASSVPLTVRVDTRAPIVSVLAPTPNEQFGTATVSAQASVQDDSPVTVTLNDGTSTRDITSTLDSNHVVSAQISFATSGQQSVTLVATDLAGNTSSVSVALVIDLAAPVVSFAAGGTPLGAAAFGPLPGDVLLLTTRVDSAASGTLAYSVRGAPLTSVAFPALSGLTDLRPVTLVEGINLISATATTAALFDTNGAPLPAKATTLNVQVVYDKTPPTAVLTVPSAGSAVLGTIELTGSAQDACPANTTCPPGGLTGVASVSFSVDSSPPVTAVLSGGVWTAAFDTTTLAPGPHSVTMSATDGVGNRSTTAPTTFIVGGVPTVAFVALVDGSSIPAGSFDVRADAVGDYTLLSKVTLSTGAQSYTCTAATPNASLSCVWANFNFASLCTVAPPKTCAVAFTAKATDTLGQVATATLNLTVDPSLKTPLRFIALPEPAAAVRGTFSLITLQAGAGFNNVTCSANGATVGSSTTGKLVAAVNTLPLNDGPLALSCTWTDIAGRTDTKSETVMVQNWRLEVEPPVLDLRSCSPSAAPVQLELEGWARADPPSGPTVGRLQAPALAGQLSAHVVSGKVDHSTTMVPATYVSLAPSTDDKAKPLELRLALNRCTLVAAVKEALAGKRGPALVTVQLRQGTVVLDGATMTITGN